MNLVEGLLLSRKDWNQSSFKKLVYSLITEEDQLLNEYELRNKIERIACGFKWPDKYDKYGNSLVTNQKIETNKEVVTYDKDQYFVCNKKIKSIDVEDSIIHNLHIEVRDKSDYIYAFKEILWKLGNVPSTSKNILQHIVKVDYSGNFTSVSDEDYAYTNLVFQKAISDMDLKLIKQKTNNGKLIYLYKNPTDKRQGFYYLGRLLTLNELSKINNVPVVTIKKRIAKGMGISRAIIK